MIDKESPEYKVGFEDGVKWENEKLSLDCIGCKKRKMAQEKLELERKIAAEVREKDRETMRKWHEYIYSLPPYRRFTFDVFENGEPSNLHATADTETEEQARNKLNKYIEDCGGGITIGKLRHSERRSRSLMASNFLEDKEHLEKAGIPDYKKPPIIYGRPC